MRNKRLLKIMFVEIRPEFRWMEFRLYAIITFIICTTIHSVITHIIVCLNLEIACPPSNKPKSGNIFGYSVYIILDHPVFRKWTVYKSSSWCKQPQRNRKRTGKGDRTQWSLHVTWFPVWCSNNLCRQRRDTGRTETPRRVEKWYSLRRVHKDNIWCCLGKRCSPWGNVLCCCAHWTERHS